MRRPIAVLLFLAAAATLSRGTAADESETYTLPLHETWKVGDVTTKHEVNREVQRQLVTGPDGSVLQQGSKEVTVEYSGVMKVLEVDADGGFSKALIYLSKWSRKSDRGEDTTLSGKHIEVAGAPKSRTVKVLTPGAAPSDEARTWLEKEFAKDSEGDADEAFNPKKAVAVGESWSPEHAMLAKMFDEMKFIPEKSKATITLKDVEDDLATLAIDFSLQAAAMPTPQGTMEWSEGGVFTMAGEGTKPLEAGDHRTSGKMSGGLKGKLNAGGAVVELDMSFSMESETKAGGTMPEVPAAK